MFPHASDNPDGEPGFFAKILDLAPGLVVKLQGVFTTMQNPESIDAVIAAAQKRGYFEDGGDMFLLLAHKFQSLTGGHNIQKTLALEALSDDTLRMLGTHRAEVQTWMELGIIRTLREALEFARSSTSIGSEEEGIAGQQRGFLEGDEEIFLGELQRLGYEVPTLENIDAVMMKKLGTSQIELLFLRKIGKIHRAAWIIKQAREDGYLLPDNWEGLMTYLMDAQGTSDVLRLENIADDTLALAVLNRAEVQGWFRHVPE